MLVNATFTLNGAPKPAFWHGLTPITTPGDMSGKRVENGWRIVEADGKNVLDAEVFVATNRFSINEGYEVGFEQRCALLTGQQWHGLWAALQRGGMACAVLMPAGSIGMPMPMHLFALGVNNVHSAINFAMFTACCVQLGTAGEPSEGDARLQGVLPASPRWPQGR